jgi:hypothetical protein
MSPLSRLRQMPATAVGRDLRTPCHSCQLALTFLFIVSPAPDCVAQVYRTSLFPFRRRNRAWYTKCNYTIFFVSLETSPYLLSSVRYFPFVVLVGRIDVRRMFRRTRVVCKSYVGLVNSCGRVSQCLTRVSAARCRCHAERSRSPSQVTAECIASSSIPSNTEACCPQGPERSHYQHERDDGTGILHTTVREI